MTVSIEYVSIIRRIILYVIGILITVISTVKADISIAYRTNSPLLKFAVSKLDNALRKINKEVNHYDLSNQSDNLGIFVLSNESEIASFSYMNEKMLLDSSIQKEGFRILRFGAENSKKIAVIARDESGAMYGVLDLTEQVYMYGGLNGVEEKICNPRFQFRAIKFNLPWSPYRSGPSTDIHIGVCRDLEFWQQFLDMMAENRFNVLSLWNLHPFPFMIKLEHFPEVCPSNTEEMFKWKSFWKNLFRMAKERGIETYIVNWNIVVSTEFAKSYGVKEKNDTSKVVREYTRECVTQVINEYEDLTGLGVTLADWMVNMTPKDREDWIEETFIAGMKEAKRPVKFIHRSVLAGSPLEMRRVIDNAQLPDPVWVEVKFNWSHGHSTPNLAITHDYSSGQIEERFWKPKPTNYKIVWMIRNEDFFILRWGEPNFIRDHIMMNDKDYVGGYFVGSEGYIPAEDYSHKNHVHQTWQYAFEKQWLFYTLWGRLLYDPETSNAHFESMFERRYGSGVGKMIMQAYSLASRMPLRLASFHAATWDFTLYSEGFLAPRESRGLSDGVSSFISINEFIKHQTLELTYLSIPDYVGTINENKDFPEELVTPLELADDSQNDGSEVLKYIKFLRSKITLYSGALECEVDDLETWAYLSLYFAEKIRGGVALATFRKTGESIEKEKAITHLECAAEHWKNVMNITKKHYIETPHVSGEIFSWEKYYDQVQRDVTIALRAKKENIE